MTTGFDMARARKNPDAWWTVAVIDPVVLRLLPFLAPRKRVTPDGLSLTSLVLALAAGVGFLQHHLVWGGVLFELHFLVDCLDGKLARVRGTQNPRGGFVDLACDMLGTSWCYATLGYTAFSGSAHAALALATATTYAVYTWSTLHRRTNIGLSAKPAREGSWLARHGMGRTPYGVECETLVLFLIPLIGREDLSRAALWVGGVFYLVAAGRNLRATYRALPST